MRKLPLAVTVLFFLSISIPAACVVEFYVDAAFKTVEATKTTDELQRDIRTDYLKCHVDGVSVYGRHVGWDGQYGTWDDVVVGPRAEWKYLRIGE